MFIDNPGCFFNQIKFHLNSIKKIGLQFPTTHKSTIQLLANNGITFGPGFTLIRLQALGARPVSAAIPNAGNLLVCVSRGYLFVAIVPIK